MEKMCEILKEIGVLHKTDAGWKCQEAHKIFKKKLGIT